MVAEEVAEAEAIRCPRFLLFKFMWQIFTIFNPALPTKIGNGEGATILPVFIGMFIRLAYIGGVIAFTIMLLIGAFEYITAGGEKDKAANAAKRITNALIGLFILFAVFAITSVVKALFGIDVLLFTLPTISP